MGGYEGEKQDYVPAIALAGKALRRERIAALRLQRVNTEKERKGGCRDS